MCEFYCHGNDFLVSQLLETILIDCRLAERGEFTMRAFMNKKIDLTQAEAVGNLLKVQTKEAQKAALWQLEGKLYSRIDGVLEKIKALRIILELAIDFAEDEVPEYNPADIERQMNEIFNDLSCLKTSAHTGIILTNGLKVGLIGSPNVGKSSIFNAFLEKERAITSNIPGTTRDYLEESFDLNGYLIKLYDTAGFQETADFVEQKGIERSREIIAGSDLVFHIISADIADDEGIAMEITAPVIKVINKVDLLSAEKVNSYVQMGFVPCSTVIDGGLNELKRVMLSQFPSIDSSADTTFLTNIRQLACVEKALESMHRAMTSTRQNIGIDFVAFDIQQASRACEEIVGSVSSEDILEKIFNNFCIGK
ncbi:MAG: tRNA uridine-5-carboxymethylaminomethyl(34) synthesis GTPase MnmE [Candidatus Cloacimonetes bacterium]|nr:tRNA uridine-5-carboxymethylaminomethyl(34) synthesis GTPase MnmE [Candidatus Cloacimonadota bacterium]